MTKNIITKECEKRTELAKEIADKCPEEYGKEIIIAGSVSRGLADENSDIEIEFLVDNMISQQDRVNWIKEIGGTEICPYGSPIFDGSEWIIFKYKDCWIEAGWQIYSNMVDNIRQIIEGKVYTHDRLILASVLENAIFLRENEILINLQKELNFYPDRLQQKIIMNTIESWNIELALKVRTVLAKRNDKIPLLERMISDVHWVLRILYAINKQWEPDWKWTNHIIDDLEIKPENLKERINSIVCINNTTKNLENCFNLICDTLDLIPEDIKSNETVQKVIKSIHKLV